MCLANFEDCVNKMPFKFAGILKKMVIELGKSGLTASDEKEFGKAYKKYAAATE